MDMTTNDAVFSLFPDTLKRMVENAVGKEAIDSVEEVRLRVGQPVLVRAGGRELLCGGQVRQALLKEILSRAAEYSAYAHADSLRDGWLPLAGGARIGVCARASGEGLRDVSSLCLRRPRAVEAISEAEFRTVYPEGFRSTLIVSPPGYGKTTLLRTLIRRLSAAGYTVGVADDRLEIAGMRGGVPSFDLGSRTDVFSGGNKRENAIRLLRSMSPDIIAFDEITSKEDIEAAEEIAFCGAGVLATAHAAGRGDLEKRKLYQALLRNGVFAMAIVITLDAGTRRYKVETF